MIPHVGRDFAGQQVYTCEFAGIHFSRHCETDLIKWVRVAAKRVYGPDTQIIFLHEDGKDETQ
jgi:hypothetical protein